MEAFEELKKEKAIEVHNKVIDVAAEAYKRELERSKEIAEQTAKLEIMPINARVLCRPYDRNPYQKLEVRESGLIIPIATGNFDNPDTGEKDTEVAFMTVGQVIEASPQCKYVKEGDDVFYVRQTGVPIPFFNQNYECVSEQMIYVVINEGLKERLLNVE